MYIGLFGEEKVTLGVGGSKTDSSMVKWFMVLRAAMPALPTMIVYTVEVVSERAIYKHVFDKWLIENT